MPSLNQCRKSKQSIRKEGLIDSLRSEQRNNQSKSRNIAERKKLLRAALESDGDKSILGQIVGKNWEDDVVKALIAEDVLKDEHEEKEFKQDIERFDTTAIDSMLKGCPTDDDKRCSYEYLRKSLKNRKSQEKASGGVFHLSCNNAPALRGLDYELLLCKLEHNSQKGPN